MSRRNLEVKIKIRPAKLPYMSREENDEEDG
jgi:hypothetical protein